MMRCYIEDEKIKGKQVNRVHCPRGQAALSMERWGAADKIEKPTEM